MTKITVGSWRKDKAGPIQVVSGAVDHKRVHYEAPAAGRLHREMKAFLSWFSKSEPADLVLKAGVAHLWFVTIHPFDDGNGRIARAIADLTPWLEWFLGCLDRAFGGAETLLAGVMRKARFWEEHGGQSLNGRQRLVINRLLDGFEGKLTSSKWAKLAKCSQDTALRDIDDLVARHILVKDPARGRSTSYALSD